MSDSNLCNLQMSAHWQHIGGGKEFKIFILLTVKVISIRRGGEEEKKE